MFQICPVCDGSGILNDLRSVSLTNTCPACKGHRIISELTGLPPSGDIEPLEKYQPQIKVFPEEKK